MPMNIETCEDAGTVKSAATKIPQTQRCFMHGSSRDARSTPGLDSKGRTRAACCIPVQSALYAAIYFMEQAGASQSPSSGIRDAGRLRLPQRGEDRARRDSSRIQRDSNGAPGIIRPLSSIRPGRDMIIT